MISKTFISRPKFALVISIVITIAGLISMALLPVNMYPQITPPQVQISASYPGASAQIVEESVIRPIEEQVNGVEDMMYIESTSSNNGTANITVYFKVGTDTDIAQVNVQNRVAKKRQTSKRPCQEEPMDSKCERRTAQTSNV